MPYLVLAIGNIPHLDQRSDWQGFACQSVALAIVWVIARKPWVRPVRPAPVEPVVTAPIP